MGTNEMLKGYNMDNFMEYCRYYNSAENNDFCNDADYLLRFWREAKGEYLYTLMDEELILSKKFTYERDRVEIKDALEEMVEKYNWFYHRFFEVLHKALGAEFSTDTHNYGWQYPNEDNASFYCAVRDWLTPDYLIDNCVEEKVQGTINGKLIKINCGEKIMRALRKICIAVSEAGFEDFTNKLEEMRLDHSRIFNQKVLTGDLCLSIHPLDYATASDNDNGWSSCMSWQEDGCYRLGTVEMMNSPMVICAYLKSEVQEMHFGNYTWPSKKWRAWIVVNKDAIMCNRNYPYDNDSLAKECINWVAELAKKNLDWEFNNEITTSNWLYENSKIKLQYETNFMYNDYNEDMWITIRPNLSKGHHYYNYSGAANCMNCGDEIEWDGKQDSSTLCCNACRNIRYCSVCGGVITDSDEWYYDPNDELMCADCYSQNVTHCEICDVDIYAEESTHVIAPINKKLYSELTGQAEWSAPWCEQNLCPDCAADLGITEDVLLSSSDISFSKDWTINRWNVEDVLDPRKVPITVFYTLLGYKSTKNDWEQREINDLHLSELWENYRQYVIEVLGETD